MDRKRIVTVLVSMVVGFFAFTGVMTFVAFAHCTETGRVCTIEGKR